MKRDTKKIEMAMKGGSKPHHMPPGANYVANRRDKTRGRSEPQPGVKEMMTHKAHQPPLNILLTKPDLLKRLLATHTCLTETPHGPLAKPVGKSEPLLCSYSTQIPRK